MAGVGQAFSIVLRHEGTHRENPAFDSLQRLLVAKSLIQQLRVGDHVR